MIPRYSRPEMTAIWEPQTRFRIWFEIEAHAADAMAEAGIVPKAAAQKIWAMGRDAIFDVARIDAIEAETKHDVIAFLTHLSEIVMVRMPLPAWVRVPPPETIPAKVMLSVRLKTRAPSLATSPVIEPAAAPLPICSVPALIAVPPV
jgi:hypothetical protein